jgi:hypothetical protein
VADPDAMVIGPGPSVGSSLRLVSQCSNMPVRELAAQIVAKVTG